MSALLRGRSAICRLLPFLGRSNVAENINIRHISQKIKSNSKTAVSLTRNYVSTSSRNQIQVSARNFETMPKQTLASIPRNLDEALNTIDREVRRVGRVRKDVVMTTYQSLQKSGHLTDHQSLLLLRCFGAVMVDEAPAVRSEMVEQVWTGLKDLGVKYDVKHYNALLGVYLQNEHKFSPSEFLGKMETEGITPIRLTFQRLVSGYCQDGDIAGASQILEHMKSANLPINESVFNALIVGHMRAGDEESATGILKIMKESGIPPSGDTFSILMVELARKGDIESIEKISAEALEAQVSTYPSHYLDVVQTLASSGHSQHIDRVLGVCSKSNTAWYNQDCMNAVLQAVARGHDDVAHKLFLSMQHPTLMDEMEATFGRFLIKAMIKHERPLESVVSVINDLSSRGLNADNVDFIAQWALVYEKPDYALETFDLMMKAGLPLRTHFFWPVFIGYRNQKNAEGIYKAVRIMEEKVEKSQEFLHTLYDYIVPSLLKAGEDRDSITNKLKEIGIAEGDVNFAFTLIMVKEKKAEEAVNFAKDRNVTFHHGILRSHLFFLFRNTKDSEIVLELLKLAQTGGRTSQRFQVTDLASSYLFYTMDGNKNDTDKIEKTVQAMIDMKLGVTVKEDLTEKLTAFGVSLKLIEELVSVEVAVPAASQQRNQRNRRPLEQNLLGQKSMEELEELLVKNRATDSNVKGPLKRLLEMHCLAGNIARVEEIKTELDSLGFIYSPEMARSLMCLATMHKKDLTEALKYKDMLETQFDNFSAFASEIINLASLYVLQGNVEAAVTSLKEYRDKYQHYIDEKGLAESYVNENHCIKLIENCQSAGLMEAAKMMIDTVFECGLIKNGCYTLLDAYVQGYLEKGDTNGVVEAWTYCTKQYRRTPKVEGVFKLLIEKEDPEKLQQVMDLASSSLGEMQALHHLFFSFVECGKESQARRILETPGMRAMMDVIDNYGNNLINQKKTKELESLVNVTKGLFSLDREHMLFLQMKGYCIESDMEKALNILSVMEEENINPRARTLRYLGKTLQSKGMEVPFEIPAPPEPRPTTPAQPRRPVVKEIIEAPSNLTPVETDVLEELKSGNITPIKDLQALKESVGGTFSLEFINAMANVLYKAKMNRALQFLMNDLASCGEHDALEKMMKSNLDLSSGFTYIQQALSSVYLENGTPMKILDKLTEDKRNVNKFLGPAICRKFYEMYPDLFKKVEEIVDSGDSNPNLQALQTLWQLYFKTEQFDKATSLLHRYPTFAKRLRISGVCAQAKKDNREDLLKYLMDTAGKESESNKAFIYSYLIGLRGDQNDWQGALDLLEKVKEDGMTTDDLRPAPLAQLESLLVNNDQSVPWQVGKYNQTKKVVSEDSSSSSSSSDSSDSDSDSAAEPSVSI